MNFRKKSNNSYVSKNSISLCRNIHTRRDWWAKLIDRKFHSFVLMPNTSFWFCLILRRNYSLIKVAVPIQSSIKFIIRCRSSKIENKITNKRCYGQENEFNELKYLVNKEKLLSLAANLISSSILEKKKTLRIEYSLW